MQRAMYEKMALKPFLYAMFGMDLQHADKSPSYA
jgi:hypothetical protein